MSRATNHKSRLSKEIIPDDHLSLIFAYPFEKCRFRKDWEFLLEEEQSALLSHLIGYFTIFKSWLKEQCESVFETVCDFFSMPADIICKFKPPFLKISGREGYNRAMNGIYVRGDSIHSGRCYYKHAHYDFTIRYYQASKTDDDFRDKWVIDWRVGLQSDNIGAAICRDGAKDFLEPWMCTQKFTIYDGKRVGCKWVRDQKVILTAMKPREVQELDPNTELGFYRVCLGMIVRKTETLDSEEVKTLPIGSRVNVAQRKGRRVRIDSPIAGWCSLISRQGEIILTKIFDKKSLETCTPKKRIPMRTFTYVFETVCLHEDWEFLNQAEFLSLSSHLAGYFSIGGFWPKAESEDIFKIVCDYLRN